ESRTLNERAGNSAMRKSYSVRSAVFLCLGLLAVDVARAKPLTGIAGRARLSIDSDGALPTQSNDERETTLESALPRDGLQLYFEVRGEGFSQLARLASTAMSNSAQPGGLSIKDLSGFALAHLAELSRARIAMVTYAGSGFAIAIETGNSGEAKRI